MRRRLFLTLILSVTAPLLLSGQPYPQIYNSGFDTWSKKAGAWNLYPLSPTAEQCVWDTANHGMSLLGINGTTPEREHVAVKGEGKCAVRIESKKILWAFVAGNLYTGRFVRIVKFKGAELEFGIPFTARPKRFSGYYHYIPQTVDFAKPPYLSMKGKQDVGKIEVILTDWTEPRTIDTTRDSFPDAANDPTVIGRATLYLDRATDGYVHFDIPFEYRDGRTPSYIVVTAAASRYGDFFTGADGTVLYLDEFRLDY